MGTKDYNFRFQDPTFFDTSQNQYLHQKYINFVQDYFIVQKVYIVYIGSIILGK